MQKFAILAATLLLASQAHAQIRPPEEGYWTPAPSLIARLESGLKIMSSPDEAQYNLPQYDRYYYGATVRGQRIVRGILIVPPNREDHPQTGVHITEKQYMPTLHGAGCAHVFVTYYVEKDSSYSQCDMLGSDAPPSEQPHWKPDEQTAARMEAVIQERMHRAGLPDLSRFGRYYVGVTLDEKPMIRGRIIERHAAVGAALAVDGGVHLQSEWDDASLVFDGGCSNIAVTYDVKAAKFTELACDAQGGSGALKPEG